MTGKQINGFEERVILVDILDREIGTAEKLAAHRSAQLHRAFSVFIYDRSGRLLLQRRADEKYHSGGLWSNTCCGHPRPGETVIEAAERRLLEEMGFTTSLRRLATFQYHVQVTSDLWESEIDHVLGGAFDGIPDPTQREVSAWRWASREELEVEMNRHPERYTAWFRQALEEVDRHMQTVPQAVQDL